ncbi:MAG: GNAT family N-acetyltransferase [Ferruginibacter sp.]|nr:GNAT family N-acetyltransferase [Ferruginibacter sp.]MCC7379125.1 GNAT family N-acetyltransferase [Chitinophagaceae bacterium]
MIEIVRAGTNDAQLLEIIGKQALLESHGHSAPKADMDAYVNKYYCADFFKTEISNPANIYHIMYYDKEPAGYSKIIFNYPHSNINISHVTKLERLYVLKKFYDCKLGKPLFEFNLQLSKSNNQQAMWLFVWKENPRAIKFYLKNGFTIIGNHDFVISPTHSNPNHHMILQY